MSLKLVTTPFGDQVRTVYEAERKRLDMLGDALALLTRLEGDGWLSPDVARQARREAFDVWLQYAREDRT